MIDLDLAIICNAKKPSDHCKTNCFHGKPHVRTTERNGQCFGKKMICTLSLGGMVNVQCRLLTKDEKTFHNKQAFLRNIKIKKVK